MGLIFNLTQLIPIWISQPKKWIKTRGPPLSLSIYFEPRSPLLNVVEGGRGKIHETKVTRVAPSISHLFFVDYSLLYCKEKINEVTVIKDVLDVCIIVSLGNLLASINLLPTLVKELIFVEKEN